MPPSGARLSPQQIDAVAVYVSSAAGRRGRAPPGPGDPEGRPTVYDRLVLEIAAGGFDFVARFEEEAAPQTVAAFRRLLPLESRIIHVRWSGEGGWIPFGDLDVGIGPRTRPAIRTRVKSCSTPAGCPRPSSCSPTATSASPRRRGPLAGNHFATILEGNENLRELGRKFLWEGAQEIRFSES